MKRLVRYLPVTLAAAVLAGGGVFLRAQEVSPPPNAPIGQLAPTPDDSIPEPPPPPDAAANPGNPNAAAAPNATQGEPEVYNRGPIHEAFAAPAVTDPAEAPVVSRQPPEAIDEVPPEQAPEGDNVVWIPGYWAFDDDLNDYLWVSGLWRDAPPGRRWVPGYWVQAQGGWQWIAGMWVDEQADDLAYLPPPPPTQEVGPSSPSPGEGYFWIPGNWMYASNNYQWQPGYWAMQQPNWVWYPACYAWTPRGYLYNPGFWDYALAYRGLPFAPVYFPGYRWSRPFTPYVALNPWNSLVLQLFVRPGFGRYYFGNYYGPQFAGRGFLPFHAYGQRGYDPLFVYFNGRMGPGFGNRLAGWHNYFNANPDFRPRLTFREQQNFIARNRGNNAVIAAANVSSDLNALVRSRDNRVTFTNVSLQDRQRLSTEARALRDFGRERARVETAAGGRGAANVNADARLKLQLPERAALRPGDRGALRGSSQTSVDVPERPDRAQRQPGSPPANATQPSDRGPGQGRGPAAGRNRAPDGDLPRLPAADGIEGATPDRNPGAGNPRPDAGNPPSGNRPGQAPGIGDRPPAGLNPRPGNERDDGNPPGVGPAPRPGVGGASPPARGGDPAPRPTPPQRGNEGSNPPPRVAPPGVGPGGPGPANPGRGGGGPAPNPKVNPGAGAPSSPAPKANPGGGGGGRGGEGGGGRRGKDD